ncbi:hypothetical protein D3C76_1324910 [compost metagenome]
MTLEDLHRKTCLVQRHTRSDTARAGADDSHALAFDPQAGGCADFGFDHLWIPRFYCYLCVADRSDNALRGTLTTLGVAAPIAYFAIWHRKVRCQVSGFIVCLVNTNNQIQTSFKAVRSPPSCPVFRTPRGSIIMIFASPCAAVLCSTPRGTTYNSPGCT